MLKSALGHAILSPQADTVDFESSLTHLRLPSPQVRLDSDDSERNGGCSSTQSPPPTMPSETLVSVCSAPSDADFDFQLSLGSVSSSDMDLTNTDWSIEASTADVSVADSAPRRRQSTRKSSKRGRCAVEVAERAKQSEEAVVQDYLHTFSSSPPPTDDDSVAAILSTTNSVTCCLCGQPSGVCSGLFAHLTNEDEDRPPQTVEQPVKRHPCDIEGSSVLDGERACQGTSQSSANSLCQPLPVALSAEKVSLETDQHVGLDDSSYITESDLESPEWVTDCLLQELKNVVDHIDSGLLSALPTTGASTENLPGLLQQALDDNMDANVLHDDWKSIAPQCRNGHSGARNWCRPLEQFWYDLCGDANCEPCMDAFFMGTDADEVPDSIALADAPPSADNSHLCNYTLQSELPLRKETEQTACHVAEAPSAVAEPNAPEQSSQSRFTAKLEATKKKKRKVFAERSNNTPVRRRSSSKKVGSASREVSQPAHRIKQRQDRLCVGAISPSSSSSSLVSMEASPTPAASGTHYQRNSVVLTNSRKTMILSRSKSTHKERH